MEHDLHNRLKGKIVITLDFIDTDDTFPGQVIDTIGFESLEYFIFAENINDGNYDFLLEDDDDAGFGSPTTVGPDDILGSTVGFTAASNETLKRIGSIGKKRYQRLSIVSTNVNIGGTPMSGIAVLGHTYVNPVPDVSEVL